jgi:hypothetical protein
MGPILLLLLFLGGTMVLIVGGTRVSLYLFTQNALENQPIVHRTPIVTEKPIVERQANYRIAETENTSARYARGSLMVLASMLLLTIIAAVSILSGIPH